MAVHSKPSFIRRVDDSRAGPAGTRDPVARLRGRVLPLGSALIVAAGLCACAGPTVSAAPTVESTRMAGNICSGLMGFDVSSLYYFKCRDYLGSHARDGIAPVPVKSKSPEHQACHLIGLKDNTDDYDHCIQTMYQYDFGSVHL